ncbi:glycosyltransferase family 2 protein [Loigolactobacillus jiayinensis]|uniref:Glycosyltransferase family 2 protein n=1 Tax=Loigolactobacillus jiayinensis TaxID=2486016 RepID=A0ABW1R8I7_9LACO|nr:glycosyltransferase family 2 protein [Loigolactobacillus jiayinensis]
MNTQVTAVIVTYNRLSLLKESIAAVLAQTYSVTELLVINNHSTDGTTEYLATISDPRVQIINASKNLGGSGGFTLGLQHGFNDTTSDLVWLMDDDTIPDTTSLAELVAAADSLNGQFGFLSSNIRLMDGTPNNVPETVKSWSAKSANGLIQLASGSFVSLLVPRAAIAAVGLSIPEFFIWFDDIEFTRRLARFAPAYMVLSANVLHKTKGGREPDILTDNASRLPLYYYYFRNKYYLERVTDGRKGTFKESYRNFVKLLQVLFSKQPQRWRKISIIIRGWSAGKHFQPKIRQIKSK